MRIRHLIGAIMLGSIVLSSTVGQAAVFGGSNLSFSGYPEFNEYPPSPPYGNDKYAWENYKREIENYANKAKEYVENANNDISRIQEAKQEAIQKANNAVDEYNRSVRGY